MLQWFLSEGSESCTFDTSALEAMGLDEGSIIVEAERSSSNEAEWCTVHPSMKCIAK
jgi:hypothetical protein